MFDILSTLVATSLTASTKSDFTAGAATNFMLASARAMTGEELYG